jgi:methylenetetrahydrofolate reductase (NADPH)
MPLPNGPAAPTGAPSVSFAFFPLTNAAMERTLCASVARLAPLRPAFESVTYGADGSPRDRTHEAVARIARRDARLTSAPHVTRVGARHEEITAIARRCWNAGIRHIVALHGDPVAGSIRHSASPDGFAYAANRVTGRRL